MPDDDFSRAQARSFDKAVLTFLSFVLIALLGSCGSASPSDDPGFGVTEDPRYTVEHYEQRSREEMELALAQFEQRSAQRLEWERLREERRRLEEEQGEQNPEEDTGPEYAEVELRGIIGDSERGYRFSIRIYHRDETEQGKRLTLEDEFSVRDTVWVVKDFDPATRVLTISDALDRRQIPLARGDRVPLRTDSP